MKIKQKIKHLREDKDVVDAVSQRLNDFEETHKRMPIL